MTTDKIEKNTFRVIKEQNLTATMRDGTVLRADVYRPDEPGQFATLLRRTPYNKERDTNAEMGHQLAERGYLVVIQDLRGRFASDGVFTTGFQGSEHSDSEDGYDTVEWAAKLPWSSGKVGTYGISYDGWTQWALAHTRPPHLTTMIPGCIAANALDRELSGVLRLGRVLWWNTNSMPPDERRRADEQWGTRIIEEADRMWTERDRSKWLWFMPLMEIPDDVMFGLGPHWRRWLENHAVDHFQFLEKHRLVEVPVLTMTGWYDQQIGAIKHFTGMRENGMTEHARENQYLIVGPWSHTTDLSPKVGEIDFGPEAQQDYIHIVDQWFSQWLKEEKSEVSDWPCVQLFVMGANKWRGENEWPIARTVYTDFYLHSAGHANTPAGDGMLSSEPSQDEPSDEYRYDPRDPVMTLYTPEGQHEPQDQRGLDGRHDILVYASPPIEDPIEVTGPITMKLWAASSARDTDFIVKLLDVWPNGFTQELCHGIVRARYRESFDQPSLIEPDRAYEYTIQVNPTSNLFKAGHRIRVDISSSDFPNFDRNHNTGGNDYAEVTLMTARQTIFHDQARPSRIILPIIPG